MTDKEYKIEFPICGHPELMPTLWEQKKPEPCQTIGQCPIHDYTCPICSFGVGSAPACNCPEMRAWNVGYKIGIVYEDAQFKAVREVIKK